MKVDREKTAFLRGLLAGFASSAQIVTYDEVRRLCRLSDEQLGSYLDDARKGRADGDPDFCAIVVKTGGMPGPGWGDLGKWAKEAQRVHRYWGDRRRLDNPEFQKRYKRLPAIPGLQSDSGRPE